MFEPPLKPIILDTSLNERVMMYRANISSDKSDDIIFPGNESYFQGKFRATHFFFCPISYVV